MRLSLRIADSLQPGDVRRNRVVGTLIDRDGASFYLRVTAADTLRVAYGSVTQVDVSQGRSRVRSAIKYGLLEGAAFGVLLPYQNRTTENLYRSWAADAVIGAVIGAAVPDERWRRVKR